MRKPVARKPVARKPVAHKPIAALPAFMFLMAGLLTSVASAQEYQKIDVLGAAGIPTQSAETIIEQCHSQIGELSFQFKVTKADKTALGDTALKVVWDGGSKELTTDAEGSVTVGVTPDNMKGITLQIPANCECELVESPIRMASEGQQISGAEDEDNRRDARRGGETVVRPSEQEEDSAAAPVRQAYAALRTSIANGDWPNAQKQMTDHGMDWLGFDSAEIIRLEIQGGVSIPGLVEAVEKLDAIAKKHGLEELKGVKEDDEFLRLTKELMGTGESRLAVISELRAASREHPFYADPFNGEVQSAVIENGKAELFVKPKKEQSGEFQMMVPDICMTFVNENGNWKFDSIDQEKTRAAMREMTPGTGLQISGAEGAGDPGMHPPQQGITVVPFSGETADGKQVSLKDYDGKVVLIDFWGTWCAPCIAQMPNIKRIHDKFGDKGFAVIGVAADEKEAVARFLEKTPLAWPNVIDGPPAEGGKSIVQSFGVNMFPTVVLLGKDGKLVSTNKHGVQLIDDIIEQLELDASDYAEFREEFVAAEKEAMKKAMEMMQEKQKQKKEQDEADSGKDSSESPSTSSRTPSS